MKDPLTWPVLASAFVRSFTIQGSWNYHTMIGSGFAFAILPGLRRLYDGDPAAFGAAVRRHLEHFNAHPYLVGLALGAVLRLEADGTDPETVRRFKTAVRGPLGGLGDSLVWATWLPVVSMLALASYWLGAPGWVAVGGFLLLYNAGHVALRVWGFRTGLREGLAVGKRIGEAALPTLTRRLQTVEAMVLGVLAGVVLVAPAGLAPSGPVWIGLATGVFIAGTWLGHLLWRPAAVAVVVATGLIAAWGVLA